MFIAFAFRIHENWIRVHDRACNVDNEITIKANAQKVIIKCTEKIKCKCSYWIQIAIITTQNETESDNNFSVFYNK